MIRILHSKTGTYIYTWGADSIALNMFSPDDSDDELTFIKDRGDPHSSRSQFIKLLRQMTPALSILLLTIL